MSYSYWRKAGRRAKLGKIWDYRVLIFSVYRVLLTVIKCSRSHVLIISESCIADFNYWYVKHAEFDYFTHLTLTAHYITLYQHL